MAIRHSELTNKHGERLVAEAFESQLDSTSHLWLSLKLQDVPEIDLFLLDEKLGAFMIDVKGVTLYQIREFTRGRAAFDYHASGKFDHPLDKLFDARGKLFDFWKRHRILPADRPFVSLTLAWPRIARADWDAWQRQIKGVFDGPFSKSMVFSDDLLSSALLRRRLAHLVAHPLICESAQRATRISARVLADIARVLDGIAAPPTPTAYDKTRLENLEREAVNKQFLARVDRTTPFLCVGYPGTGKTFRGLAYALSRARAGEKVLFLCFNKTLATDMRRLVSFARDASVLTSELQIADVFDDIRRRTAVQGIDFDADEPDTWAELVLEALIKSGARRAEFDAVVLDEAQDLKNWMLEYAQYLCRATENLFVIEGRGQRIYESRRPRRLVQWEQEIRATNKRNLFQCNRVFRNTDATAKVALLFYECFLDKAGARKYFLDRLTRASSAQQLELGFDRVGGVTPHLVSLEYTTPDRATQAINPDACTEEASKLIRPLVCEYYDKARAMGHPGELLILVPGTTGRTIGRRFAWDWARVVSNVLDAEQIAYIDYTDADLRRTSWNPDEVRLCTFHSARGLEGSYVLVLGFHCLVDLANSIAQEPAHLGNIVLSRAIYDTCVVYPRQVQDDTIVAFLRYLCELVGGGAQKNS